MKLRTDFVTNSSSSSYIVCKDMITPIQALGIRYHEDIVMSQNVYDYGIPDPWRVSEDDENIYVRTDMDNFDIYQFMVNYLGIPEDAITDE